MSVRYVLFCLKLNLEDMRKEEQKLIFICKCDVCSKYFFNQFKFEIYDCGVKWNEWNFMFYNLLVRVNCIQNYFSFRGYFLIKLFLLLVGRNFKWNRWDIFVG